MAFCNILRHTDVIGSTGPPAMTDRVNSSANSVEIGLTRSIGYADTVENLQFQPFSPIFDLIGSAFVRYRVTGLKFIYEPQASSTTEERLVFAYASDPAHPLIRAGAPSAGKLLSVADSIAFMPWRGWELDVSKNVRQDLLYTESTATGTTDLQLDTINRFSAFGVIGCVGASEDMTGNIPCGVLYMELKVELHEFCPVVDDLPAMVARREKIRKKHVEKMKDRESEGLISFPQPIEHQPNRKDKGVVQLSKVTPDRPSTLLLSELVSKGVITREELVAAGIVIEET